MAKKKDEKQIEFINLFIDFCYDDFKEASSADQIRYRVKYFDKIISEKAVKAESITKDPWDVCLEYQEKCIEFLEWFLENRYKDIFLVYKIPNAFFMAGSEKGKSFLLMNYDGSAEKSEMFHYRFGPVPIGKEVAYTIFKLDSKGKHYTKLFPSPSVKFLNAIENYNSESIIKCPKCKKIFFNPTKRKKIYCSLRCQNLAAVHRKRSK